jgi:hypothetical protein
MRQGNPDQAYLTWQYPTARGEQYLIRCQCHIETWQTWRPGDPPYRCPVTGTEELPLSPTSQTNIVLREVMDERMAQNTKWGEQNHPDGTGLPYDIAWASIDRAKCQANGPDTDNWRDILQKEVSEAFAEVDPVKLRNEVLQIAAVAVAWIEAIDRRQI